MEDGLRQRAWSIAPETGIDRFTPKEQNAVVRVFWNRGLGLLRESPCLLPRLWASLRDSRQMPRVKLVRRRASAAST
jgi:hypothetical protein